MLGPVSRITGQLRRSVLQTTVRNGSHGGVVGENLPFDINNKNKVTFHFLWFFATGFGAPFLVLWHQMRKNTLTS